MRIIFFGSPTEAAGALDALISAGHDIAAVYSQPDRKAGRGRSKTPTPVKTFALEHGLEVFTPKTFRNNDEEVARLTEFQADVFVVVAYGRILPAEILQIPPVGVVNIHPSLLPKYRGSSPVVSAILSGENETGVTVMLLDEGMDTGPTLAQSDPIRMTGTERGAEFQALLFKKGASMLPAVLDGLQSGAITPQAQNDAEATVTRMLERSDGEIDWSQSAGHIDRMIRAYDPWPGTSTRWNGKGLKVIDAEIQTGTSGAAGEVSVVDSNLLVGTGEGSLRLTRVQLEGRQAVSADDFLRGYPEIAGAVLGE